MQIRRRDFQRVARLDFQRAARLDSRQDSHGTRARPAARSAEAERTAGQPPARAAPRRIHRVEIPASQVAPLQDRCEES